MKGEKGRKSLASNGSGDASTLVASKVDASQMDTKESELGGMVSEEQMPVPSRPLTEVSGWQAVPEYGADSIAPSSSTHRLMRFAYYLLLIIFIVSVGVFLWFMFTDDSVRENTDVSEEGGSVQRVLTVDERVGVLQQLEAVSEASGVQMPSLESRLQTLQELERASRSAKAMSSSTPSGDIAPTSPSIEP